VVFRWQRSTFGPQSAVEQELWRRRPWFRSCAVSFSATEEIGLNSAGRSAGVCLAHPTAQVGGENSRALCSFRPAALYSPETQAWSGGEYAQAAGIGSSELRPVRGFIEVSAGSDAGTNIPVAVIRGSKPGPTLALVAGAHGAESASIIALEKLIQELNPADISGTVIIVSLVNIASFEQKVPHVNPGWDAKKGQTFCGGCLLRSD
jgi:hypothetical protein